MAIQLSEIIRNNQLDAIEDYIGTGAWLSILTGAKSATCADAQTGTLLSTIYLPDDWMDAAASGEKELLGTWQDTDAAETGTAGYFRIYKSGVLTAMIQGTITETGGGGDLELSTVSIVAGMKVVINSYNILAGNA